MIFAFIPILFAGGVQGRFIGPMALTFIIAVLASMVVAMTVTPALCALFLTAREDTEESPLLEVAQSCADRRSRRRAPSLVGDRAAADVERRGCDQHRSLSS